MLYTEKWDDRKAKTFHTLLERRDSWFTVRGGQISRLRSGAQCAGGALRDQCCREEACMLDRLGPLQPWLVVRRRPPGGGRDRSRERSRQSLKLVQPRFGFLMFLFAVTAVCCQSSTGT